MKNISACFIAIIILFSACNNNRQSSEQIGNNTTIALKKPKKDTVSVDISGHSDIPELSPGKDTMQLNPEMHAGQQITIPMDVLAGDSIFGKLMSEDKSANIRFSQIALPGQNFDGPFGRELAYKVKKPGRLALIIVHNLMAGDPRNGSFTLEDLGEMKSGPNHFEPHLNIIDESDN